jgi:hypothetical protein
MHASKLLSTKYSTSDPDVTYSGMEPENFDVDASLFDPWALPVRRKRL